MAKKYLDYNGVLYLWQKIRNAFVSDVTWDSTNRKLVKKKKTGTSGAEQSSDIVTFASVATSGSYNDLSNKPTIPTLENVFGKVKVGSTYIIADTNKDTLELEAGSNVTLTPDVENDKVTIGVTIPATGVSDVEVDGTSVVTDGVAEIDLTGKVDKVSGKGLSTNDYTTAEKNKLSGIATGAEVNVQSDWNQTNVHADDYIKNKPTIPSLPIAAEDISYDPLSDKLLDPIDDVQTALDLIDAVVYGMHSSKGSANGLATLDANGLVPSSQLPSYVDDVIEAYARSGQTALSSTWLATESASGTVITPEAGKIYVLMADSGDYAANTQFRWGGSAYVKLADGGVSAITNAEIDTICV